MLGCLEEAWKRNTQGQRGLSPGPPARGTGVLVREVCDVKGKAISAWEVPTRRRNEEYPAGSLQTTWTIFRKSPGTGKGSGESSGTPGKGLARSIHTLRPSGSQNHERTVTPRPFTGRWFPRCARSLPTRGPSLLGGEYWVRRVPERQVRRAPLPGVSCEAVRLDGPLEPGFPSLGRTHELRALLPGPQ